MKKICQSEDCHYMLAVFVIAATALVCSPLANTQNYHVVSFVLLFVVSLLALFMGMGPVFVASTLSALVWNFLFIPPHYTFHIEKTEDILMFGMFFLIVLLNGVLTSRVRRQEKLAIEREERTNALFQLTKELSRSGGMEQVLAVAREGIKSNFLTDPIFILRDGDYSSLLEVGLNNPRKLSRDENIVAEWVFKNSRSAGKYYQNFPEMESTFYPLTGTMLNPGVLIVNPEKEFTGAVKSFWETFLTQISNALEREFLGQLAQKVRFLDESDRLYKTLFNSISHELRIPVSTIMGAADSLVNSSHPENIQSALSNEIFTASLRLNRLIENLLSMSRLESGFITVRLDWHDMNDLVNKVVEDLSDELKPFSLDVYIPDNMPLVRIDYGLMEQVLYNLLFNATQHSPAASKIELHTLYQDAELIIEILDSGTGFNEKDLSGVFNKPFRIESGKVGGLGLGLSIVKGFVEAHKGTVTVNNRETGGARFTIRIPSLNPEIHTLEFIKNERE